MYICLWFVILFGVINLGTAEREPWAGRRLPALLTGVRLHLKSSRTTPACSLLLLCITLASVSPLGYDAWGFLSFTMSSFWPINGIPPNTGEVRWRVQGTAVLGPCYAFDLGHSLLPLADLTLQTLWPWYFSLIRFSVSIESFPKINILRIPVPAVTLEIRSSHHISHTT